MVTYDNVEDNEFHLDLWTREFNQRVCQYLFWVYIISEKHVEEKSILPSTEGYGLS